MCIGYSNRNSDVALSSWKNDKKWFSLALIRHCRNINVLKMLVRESSQSLPRRLVASGGLDSGQVWVSLM